MKKLITIAAMLVMAFQGILFAQERSSQKIALDLQEEWSRGSADEMYHIVVLMRHQFDEHEMTRQTQYLDKAQKREFVVNELQRIAKEEQKELLKELQQGQKGGLIENVRSFWIFNGICCSATKDMVLSIAERPDVAFVSKDLHIHITDGERDEEQDNDNLRATNQWNVNKVNAPAVWALGYTGRGVIVAVIDTGVNYNHTDIKNNMWDGGEEFPNHGWDFINNDNDPMDDQGHGTHCAGTVSSYGTNSKQCGIAKDATIMALKSMGPSGGDKSYTWAAIQFAVSHGADILSLSLGSDGDGGDWCDRVVMENVLYCGVVASVAAGNSGNIYENGHLKYPVPYNVGSPGCCPSPWRHPDQTLDGGRSAVVTVGATTSNDTHSSFSSFGPSTWTEGSHIGPFYDYPWIENDAQNIGLIKPDIAAPGSSIVSLSYSSNTGYSTKDGTSMATPCVAGVMALMLEANPTLTPAEIDSIIETTAVACNGQTTKNNYFGSGRIDALAAINYMTGINAPTNLIANVNDFDVSLSWSPASNVTSYSIYRNGTVIAPSVSGTTYLDENVPAGENTYYVRSNGNNGQASLPSNEVTVTIAASHTPFHLEATEINTTDRTVELRWNQLYYGEKNSFYFPVGEAHIAAQIYPTSILRSYAGMQIENITFIGAHANSGFTIRLYEGDAMTPGMLVHSGSITTTEDDQQVDYVLDNPIPINPNKTLWLTIETSDSFMVGTYNDIESGDAFLLGYPNEAFWIPQAGYSWSFRMGLGESEGFKHRLYRNGTIVASNIDVTHHTAEYLQGINNYQISAYSDDYESRLSNSIILVDGNGSTSSLIMDENDRLYGLAGSCLTVSGTLSNTYPEHIILEDGAQLINDSEGVGATIMKTIQPYTEDKRDGWNLITSPIIESITPTRSNGLLSNSYDLYLFDQSGTDENDNGKEWRNYKAEAFETIDHTVGYLYANNEETTLSFVGTLAGTAEPTDLVLNSDAEFAGFNLIGNPYPCNAYIEKPFYVLEYDAELDGTRFVLGDNSLPISSCSAVLVQALSTGESVTFYKEQLPEASKIAVKLIQADQKSIVPIDQVRIMFQQQCQLDKYPQKNAVSTIYIPQNGKNLAVASANGQTEMPINLKTTKNGTYTISIEANNIDLDYLHLIDNITGNEVDLLETPSYTFEAKTTDYTSRFRLVFSDNEDVVSDNAPFAFINDGNITINQEGTLQIVDMTGRVVVSHSGRIECVSTAEMTAGVYVLRLITDEGVKTQKIVIE